MLKGGYVLKEHKELVEFDIEPGMPPNTQIKFDGRGDSLPGIIPGDVVIGLRELENPIFKRVGMDLHISKTIPLVDALCGFKFSLTHLDDRILHLQSKHIISIKEPTRLIKGEGMVNYKDKSIKGNLIITFEIVSPTHLIVDQRNAIKQILGSESISENSLNDTQVLDAVFK
jgi:DnaJ-class molecular chaperone